MNNNLYDNYVAEINRYATFKDNWAEEESLAPKKKDIANALKVLSLWPKDLPLICPMISYDGTLGFYVDSADYYIDLEIENKNQISIYVRNKNSTKEEFQDNIEINEQLTEFLKEKIHFLVQK